MVDTGKVRRKKEGGEEYVLKPSCLIEYNRGMGGPIFCKFPAYARVSKDIKKNVLLYG